MLSDLMMSQEAAMLIPGRQTYQRSFHQTSSTLDLPGKHSNPQQTAGMGWKGKWSKRTLLVQICHRRMNSRPAMIQALFWFNMRAATHWRRTISTYHCKEGGIFTHVGINSIRNLEMDIRAPIPHAVIISIQRLAGDDLAGRHA